MSFSGLKIHLALLNCLSFAFVGMVLGLCVREVNESESERERECVYCIKVPVWVE